MRRQRISGHMTSMPPRRGYPTDLSDERWALMEPVLTAWRAERQQTSLGLGGPLADLREVMNAILYINRTGVPWGLLPHDFPPKSTVFSHFKAWTNDGVLEQLGVRLRRIVREQVGRAAEPTACAIDAQSVKTAHTVPTATQGMDPGKKIVGRKRSVVVDTLGLLLAVIVTAANVSDNEAGKTLLTQVAADHPTISKAWVDSGYKVKAVEHGATLGIDVDIVPTPSQGRGFQVIPRRWVVERFFGWIMMHRRLARDYETKPEHSAAMIRIAMIDNLARRATGENVITWHNP